MSKEGSVVRTLKTRTHKKIFKIFQINRRLATWLWKRERTGLHLLHAFPGWCQLSTAVVLGPWASPLF